MAESSHYFSVFVSEVYSSVACWCNGYGVGLVIEKLQINQSINQLIFIVA